MMSYITNNYEYSLGKLHLGLRDLQINDLISYSKSSCKVFTAIKLLFTGKGIITDGQITNFLNNKKDHILKHYPELRTLFNTYKVAVNSFQSQQPKPHVFKQISLEKKEITEPEMRTELETHVGDVAQKSLDPQFNEEKKETPAQPVVPKEQPFIKDEVVQDQKLFSQESARLTKENNVKEAEVIQDKTPIKKLEPTIEGEVKIEAKEQVGKRDFNEMEKKILAISAQQIESIAKKIVARVMSHLKIDVSYKPLAGETYPDANGKRHQVYWDQYDPNSKFMKTFLPIVIKIITDSFSDPTNFVENGLDFILMKCDKNLINCEGLLSQIIDENFKTIAIELKKNIDVLALNSLEYKITLKVNLTNNKENPQLNFDIFTMYNGAQMGHTGGDLKNFEKYAIKSMV